MITEIVTCMPRMAQIQLAHQVKLTERIPGALAEVGVWKGGSAAQISLIRDKAKTLHLFDTFTGMPPTQAIDQHLAGSFADTSLEAVREYLGGEPNIEFHPGRFPETAAVVENERFSFVHLDGDLYQTTLDGLEFFYPRMNRGGIILLDDYGREDCPGVKLAAHAFMSNKPEPLEWVGEFEAAQVRIVKL